MFRQSAHSLVIWKYAPIILFILFTTPAVVHGASNCRISTRNITLNFGTLDPFNPVNVTVNGTATFRCVGSDPFVLFTVTDDDGLYETGPGQNRMRNSTLPAEHISYSLFLTPASGTIPRRVDQTLSITATIAGMDYQNAAAGLYADIVTITITP